LLSLIIALLFQTGISTYPLFGSNNVLMKDFSPETMYNSRSKSISNGYRAIVRYDEGFVAAGSGGRLDWITVSGKIVKSEKIEVENYNCLLSQNNDIVVAGEHGAMFVSSEKGTFTKINSGTDKNINSIVMFKGKIIAGTDDGEIVSGDGNGSFSKIHLAVKGNIVSVSARNTDCYGVTDKGEIVHTTDGIQWDIFDFNQVYKTFYKSCAFTSILATETGVAVAGVYDDGSPVFMFSTLGKVWSERVLVYKDQQGNQELLTDRPTGIFYDDSHDLFYLVCDAGKLMKLPSCSHCNELAEFTEFNLAGISGTNEMLMIVGEGFFIKPISF
jgi:hypothetical protein